MAKRISARAPERTNPGPILDNPNFFGEDLDDLLFVALGVGAAGAVNDKLVHPIIGNAIPIGNSSDIAGKAIDALTTAISGVTVGLVARYFSAQRAAQLKRGGVMYGVAKAFSAVVPQFSLSAKFPDLPFPSFGAAQKAAAAASGTAALPPGSSASVVPPVSQATTTSLGI